MANNQQLRSILAQKFPYKNLNTLQDRKLRDMFIAVIESFPNTTDAPKADLVNGLVPVEQLPIQTNAGFQAAIIALQQTVAEQQQAIASLQEDNTSIRMVLGTFENLLSFYFGGAEIKTGIKCKGGVSTTTGGNATAYLTIDGSPGGDAIFTQTPLVFAFSLGNAGGNGKWNTAINIAVNLKSATLEMKQPKYTLLGLISNLEAVPNGTSVMWFAFGV